MYFILQLDSFKRNLTNKHVRDSFTDYRNLNRCCFYFHLHFIHFTPVFLFTRFPCSFAVKNLALFILAFLFSKFQCSSRKIHIPQFKIWKIGGKHTLKERFKLRQNRDICAYFIRFWWQCFNFLLG